MTIACALGAALFVICAALGERSALYIPAVLLMVIAAASALGAPIMLGVLP